MCVCACVIELLNDIYTAKTLEGTLHILAISLTVNI